MHRGASVLCPVMLLVGCQAQPAPTEQTPPTPVEVELPSRLASSRDALAAFERECQDGDGASCNELGKHYLSRPGADQSTTRVFSRACDAGLTTGCNNLAVMHLRHRSGRAAEDADREAVGLLRRACGTGLAAACANLGLALEKGVAGEEAIGQAAGAFRKACDGGLGRGCILLASVHARGIGTEKDPAKARRILEQACSKGDAAACKLSGKAMPADSAAGLGGPRDLYACSAGTARAMMATAIGLSSFAEPEGAPAQESACDLFSVE